MRKLKMDRESKRETVPGRNSFEKSKNATTEEKLSLRKCPHSVLMKVLHV